jgi:hypothetical protein
MSQSMTKLGRAPRAGAFTAILAIIGMTAVMASVQTAKAWDQQASEAALENAASRPADGQAYADALRPRADASAHRDRRNAAPTVTRRDFQDIN